MLNEAFEDSFLNGPQDRMVDETPGQLTDAQKFGLSVNRQLIVSILLEVMTPPTYESDDTVYLDMFIARNLPKFPQFILLLVMYFIEYLSVSASIRAMMWRTTVSSAWNISSRFIRLQT